MERELEYIFNFTVALANLPYAPAFSTDEVNENRQAKGELYHIMNVMCVRSSSAVLIRKAS